MKNQKKMIRSNFYLEINELTQEVFVRVEEFTESDDLDESYQIWDKSLSST